MEKWIDDIIYNVYCNKCGCPINAPHHWENHNKCFKVSTSLTGELCKECGSFNLQPQGGCLVCQDCGWESCNG